MIRFYVLLILCVCTLTGMAQTKTVKKTKTVKTVKTTKTTVSKASTSPKTYTGRVIAVTSGGGFTGRSSSYYLQDDGRLYGKRSTEATYALLAKQTPDNTKRVFWSLEDRCQIKTTKFDFPGNTYKAVGWRKGKEQYSVTWGSPTDSVPANYEKFYSSFMTTIPASMRLK
ncbi:MAG: FAD-binding oxidoreductase [Rudanella sp.]|nr:FAD-binding oxidoreductase [Rudanella sp.]